MKGFIVTICLAFILLLISGCQMIDNPVKILKNDEIKNTTELETRDISLTHGQLEIYEKYAKTGDEQLLKQLTPLEIFKCYIHAYEIHDYNTLYGFYIKGEVYGTPKKKDFLGDMDGEKMDKENLLLIKELKENIKKLSQIRYDDDTAYIQITLKESNEISRDLVWNFKLLKNQQDIWKVDWLPIK
ncbi:hypothetical protein NSA47_07290 [Irregularibacter muris]|uniref:Lipoprotein n=1 Tax=Irregularibacter muris TaxID=1796619 RepID=A0AAE3KZJ6_9FIRM|nr:hypothetical protein [Irregularibacter muris]MCR1898786.1 hypothetical protein [Irregularibacter muris]